MVMLEGDMITMEGAGGKGTTHAGVPIALWNSWNSKQQELWLQDFNRTPEQQDYHTGASWSTGENIAYAYTGIVDHYTGLDSAQVGESTNEFIASAKDTIVDAGNIGRDLAILAGIVLLLNR